MFYKTHKNIIDKKQRGFTLIELLLVIGVTGIVTIFSGVNLLSFQRGVTLQSATDELVSNLRKIQSLSISAKGNTTYGIHFGTDSYDVFTGSSYNSGNSTNITISLPRNVVFTNINFSPEDNIIFEKLTGYPDYTGYIEISLNEESKIITVNSEGIIEISEDSIEIPGDFNLTSPLNGFVETNTLEVSFDWDDSEGSGITYELWHSTDSSFISKTVVSSTSSQVTLSSDKSLIDNSRNYWKVKAINDVGFSKWSSQTWFVDTSVNLSLGDFDLISPSNGQTISNNLPAFDWEDSVAQGGSLVTYTLWVDDDSDFSSLILEKSGLTNSEYQSVISDNLALGNTYYWAVKATDGFTEIWSNQQDWSFSTLANDLPENFDLSFPNDNDVISTSLVNFNWTQSSDPDGGLVTYDLWVDDDSDFSSLILEKNGLNNNYYSMVSGEDLPSGTYYWKVRAIDDEGSIVWSNQIDWSFTLDINVPPDSFNLLSPINSEVEESLSFTFDWEDSIDPNVSDTVTYSLIIDDNSTFINPDLTISDLSNSEYVINAGDLLNNNRYYWKVIATDGELTTESSQTNWYFDIDAGIFVDQSVSVSGDGSDWNNAFKTIGEAINVLQSGDKVNIASGNYAEYINLSTIYSGVSSNPTEFIGKDGDVVTVSGESNTSSLRLDGVEYMEFEGITFSGADRFGAELWNSSYQIVFNDCVFSNNDQHGFYSGSVYNSYIYVQNATISDNGDNGLELRGSNITLSNLLVSNNVDYGGYFYDTNNLILTDSNIDSNGEYGLFVYYGEEIDINNNVINNSGTDRNRDNVYLYKSNSVSFHHNFLSDASARGLYLNYLDQNLGSLSPSKIHHNIAYLNSTDGIYARASYSGFIYNNTSDRNGQAGLYLQYFYGDLEVRNNNLTDNRYGLRVRNGNSRLDHNYANVWGNTTNYRDQASTYLGSGSISVNPLFVNQSGHDYHLQLNSGCIDSGDPSSFYNDVDGSRADINAITYGE